jgi:hypothetical protein
LPVAGSVELKVYDISGREVTEFGIRNSEIGENKVIWNASGLGSGVYFVKLSVDGGQSLVVSGQSLVRKVVLIK